MTCACVMNETGTKVIGFCGAHLELYCRTAECELSFRVEKLQEDFAKQLACKDAIINALVVAAHPRLCRRNGES